MIVVSSAVVLARAATPSDADLPVIGWRNVVTSATVSTTSQQANFPASNVANPATHLQWRAVDASAQYLTIATNEVDPIDYVGVAGHNFGSGEIAVSIEGSIDGGWVEIVDPVMLPDDSPAIFRFVPASFAQVRLRLHAGAQAARAAVVYAGRLLELERKVYVGHTPLPHGRKTAVTNNRSESGAFLGRIVLGEWRETTVPLSLLSPAWFRSEMVPFLRAAAEQPFFFAWRPASYPREVGYGWLTDDPRPAPAAPSNLVALELSISGIA